MCIPCTVVECISLTQHRNTNCKSIHKFNSLELKNEWKKNYTNYLHAHISKRVSTVFPYQTSVGMIFYFFSFGVNSLVPLPTESNSFCLPDKCARERKKKTCILWKSATQCTTTMHLPNLPREVGEKKTKLYMRLTLCFHHYLLK